jgi:hypothetical protein
MFGLKDLKESITVTERWVECPVKDCGRKVKRQKGSLQRKKRFKCPEHYIYISPSTFSYERDMDNLLWCHYDDLYLLNRAKRAKVEREMTRDDSVDALVWNVFRFLDLQDLIIPVFEFLLQIELEEPQIIYWSYHSGEKSVWSKLVRASREFGEDAGAGAGPDIIIDSRNALIFIQAELAAGGEMEVPREKDAKKLVSGGRSWFSKVFMSDYEEVAGEEGCCRRMRLWLLGTWMAAQEGVDFYLLDLVREGEEEGIEVIFGKHLKEGPEKIFKRITWEKIYKGIADSYVPREGKQKIITYLENKTLGYDQNRRLVKAFEL